MNDVEHNHALTTNHVERMMEPSQRGIPESYKEEALSLRERTKLGVGAIDRALRLRWKGGHPGGEKPPWVPHDLRNFLGIRPEEEARAPGGRPERSRLRRAREQGDTTRLLALVFHYKILQYRTHFRKILRASTCCKHCKWTLNPLGTSPDTAGSKSWKA